MKKSSLILLVTISFFFAASAREYPIAFTPDTTIKQHASFNKVSLIDLRHQKAHVGSLSAGVKKKPIVAAYALDSMMSSFGSVLVQQAYTKDNYTLAIALKDLVIEEKTNGEFAIGNIYLHADFFLEQHDRYTQVYHIDSLFEFRTVRNTMESLTKASNRILSGVLGYIAGLAVSGEQPSISLQEVQDMDKTARSKYPVYNQEPRRGIYYTFEQFLSNTPGDTAFTHIRNIGGEGDLVSNRFYKKETGKKKGMSLSDTACYAIYSDGRWYQPYGKKGEFREMLFRNGDFFYTQKGEGLVLLSAGSYGFFGGGIVGYLVADAVAESANDANPNRQGKAVFRYKLDPATGSGIKVERLE